MYGCVVPGPISMPRLTQPKQVVVDGSGSALGQSELRWGSVKTEGHRAGTP